MAAKLESTTFVTEGKTNGLPVGLFTHVLRFTDGDPVEGITAQTIGDYTGFLTDVWVLFDDTTTPDTITVTIYDINDNELVSQNLTASGRLTDIERPIQFVNGLKATLADNTTAGGIADITINWV